MKFYRYIFYAFVLLLVLIEYVPYVSIHTNRYILLGIHIYMYLFLISQFQGRIVNIIFSLIPVYLIYLFNQFDTSGFTNGIYNWLQVLLLPLISVEIITSKSKKFAKVLAVIICVCFVITSITTYSGCSLYPGASRRLGSTMKDGALQMIYNNLNIGGFTFIYLLPVLFSLLLYYLKHIKKVKVRLILMALMIIFGMTIIQSEYTTALFAMILSVLISLLIKEGDLKKSSIRIMLSVVIFIVIMPFLSLMLDSFSSIFVSDSISSRIREISIFASKNDASATTHLSERIYMWNKSLETFDDNLLFGSNTNGGEHSYILDCLARFGMWGIAIVYIVFKFTHKQFIACFKGSNAYQYIMVAFVISIFDCILNTFNAISVFALVIPISLYAFDDQNENLKFVIK